MGTVYNRGSRAKPTWWIKYKDPTGKIRYRKVGPDRELAKRVLAKVEGDVVAGLYGLRDDTAPQKTLAEAFEPWIAARKAPNKDGKPAIRSWQDDDGRMRLHVLPALGTMRLDRIGPGEVKTFIQEKRGKIASQTIRNCLAALSRLYNDAIESGAQLENPVARLDRATRRAIGPGWDPRKTPFLKTKDDIRRVYRAMPELSEETPWRAIFAVGVFAGLRTDEARAIAWDDLDFSAQLVQVRRQVSGPLKDDESRVAPMTETLAGVLQEWRAICKDRDGVCFPSTGNRGEYVKPHTMAQVLRDGLKKAKVEPAVTWYQATRHTFASHWVMDGGSLEKLRVVLGHSSTEVTKRYAHLVPGQFTEAERKLVDVRLGDDAEVVPIGRGRR